MASKLSRDRPHPNLGKAGTNALKWNYLGTLSASGLRFLIGVMLARILGPSPFGEVAMALLLIGLGNLFSDFGLSTILVQRSTVSDAFLQSMFTLQLLAGCFLFLVTFLLAPTISDLLHVGSSVNLLRTLALVFIVTSIGQTSNAVLRRSLQLEYLQLAQITTYGIAYIGIAIPLALLGFGAWSLVWAQLVQSLSNSAAVYWRVRHPLALGVRGLDLQTATTGLRVAGSNLLDWLITNADSILIGRFFGTTALGLYNRSYFLTFTIGNSAASSMKGVLLPVFARVQNDRDLLRKSYLSTLNLTAFAVLPIFLCVAVVSKTVIGGVYGPKWIGASGFLPPLSVGMPFFVLVAISSSTLWATGMMQREFRAQCFAGIAALGAFLVAVSVSITAIAWTVAAIYFLRFLIVARTLGIQMQIRPSEQLSSLLRPLFSGTLAATAVHFADSLLIHFGIPFTVALLCDLIVGGAAIVAIILFAPGLALDSNGMWGYSNIARHMPWLRRAISPV